MAEYDIKKKICEYLEGMGFYTYLNIVTNKNGIGDITVLHEGGVFFIETKSGSKKLSPLQKYRKKEIEEKVGIKTFKANSIEIVKRIIENGEYLSHKG